MVLLEVGVFAIIPLEVFVELICFDSLVKWRCTKGQNVKEDAQREKVRLFGLKCFLARLMDLRSHVGGSSNNLLDGFVRGGKAKVTKFQIALGWDQHIFKFDVHVGITDLVM